MRSEIRAAGRGNGSGLLGELVARAVGAVVFGASGGDGSKSDLRKTDERRTLGQTVTQLGCRSFQRQSAGDGAR